MFFLPEKGEIIMCRDMHGTYKHRKPRQVDWKFFAGFTIYFSFALLLAEILHL